MKTTTGNIDIESIKRCYVQGAEIKVNCPECKSELIKDLANNYLSYPEMNKSVSVYVFCDKCDKGYSVQVFVKSVTAEIEYDETKLEKD